MNFFDHKNLGNHLLQLCPKVVKHPVYTHTHTHTHTPWVSKPQPARLNYATCGHICKLCIYYKNYTITLVVRYTTCYFPHAAQEPAHNKGCGPLPQKCRTSIKHSVSYSTNRFLGMAQETKTK